MLVYGLCIALLFIDTGFANVCSYVYQKPSHIDAASLELYREYNGTQCRYFIQAPNDYYIVFNLSRFDLMHKSKEWTESSQKPHPNGSPSCMPRVEVVEVLEDGVEKAMLSLCADELSAGTSSSHSGGSQRVFQSNLPSVILTYTWDPGTNAVMQLSFSFNRKTCEFECNDGSCLPESNLVCNNVPDCFDRSDEINCPSTVIQPSISVSGGKNYVLLTVVILVAVVVLLVVILCVFNQFRVTNRFLHQHAQLASDNSERNQLQSSSPVIGQRWNSEVVYVPGAATSERLHQSLTEDSVSGDTTNLPPSIPISLDGEEGYQNSQQLLQQCNSQRKADRDAVYAPPNRTMCGEEDLPPPHYHRAHSVGHLDKSRMSSSSGGGGGGGRMHRAGRDCTSSPSMPSSTHSHHHHHHHHGSSSSHHHNYQRNNHNHPHQYHQQMGRYEAASSLKQQHAGGGGGGTGGFSQPPPSYNSTTNHHHNIRSAPVGPNSASNSSNPPPPSSSTTSSTTTNNSSTTASRLSSGGIGGATTTTSQPRPTRLFSAPPSVGGGGGHSRHRVGSGSMSSTTSSSSTGPPSYPPPEYSDLNEEVFGFQRQSPTNSEAAR